MDILVCLLHLVKQHNAIGTTPNGFGQHTALTVAHVSRRRTFEGRHGVCLLKLTHVDRDHVLLTAVQRVGQGEGRFSLADTAGPHQHEDTDRPSRVIQAGTGGMNALGHRLQGVALPEHTFGQHIGQVEHIFNLVANHLADRDTGPVGYHRCHGLCVNAGKNERTLALQLFELGLQAPQVFQKRLALGVTRSCLGYGGLIFTRFGFFGGSFNRPARRFAQFGANIKNCIHQALLGLPVFIQFFLLLVRLGQVALDPLATLGMVEPHGLFARQDFQLGFERRDAAPAILHFGRHGVLADGHARARGVQ